MTKLLVMALAGTGDLKIESVRGSEKKPTWFSRIWINSVERTVADLTNNWKDS